MLYTIHVGRREEEWPPQVAEASTRGEAQAQAKRLLASADPGVTKAEVRCRVTLLDTFSRLSTGTIRHRYEAAQRNGNGTEQ